MLKLDLGSGYSRKPGFLRVDADPNCEPDYCSDVSDLDGFDTGEADEIYAAHVLEHFDPDRTFSVLREWWRVLKPGGKLIVKVPDVGWATREWAAGRIRDCCLQKTIFGSDPKANDFMRHKEIFHEKKLERFLFVTGFVAIKNCTVAGSGELTFEAFKPEGK